MFCKKFLLASLIFLAKLFAINSAATVPYLEGIEFGYILSRGSPHLSDTTLSGMDGRIVLGYFNTNFQWLLGVSYLCDIKEALPPYSYPLQLGYREISLNLGSRYYPRSLIHFIPYFGVGIVLEHIMSEIGEEQPKYFTYYWIETETRLGINFFLGIHIPISYKLRLFGEGRFAILHNIGCYQVVGGIERLSVVTGFSFEL